MKKKFQLTPEQDMENALSQIRGYALRERLCADAIRQMFTVGIVVRGVVSTPKWRSRPTVELTGRGDYIQLRVNQSS